MARLGILGGAPGGSELLRTRAGGDGATPPCPAQTAVARWSSPCRCEGVVTASGGCDCRQPSPGAEDCCCCVDRLCLELGAGHDRTRDTESWSMYMGAVNSKRIVEMASFHYQISWRMRGSGANAAPCEFELNELYVATPSDDPLPATAGGYISGTWSWSAWNSGANSPLFHQSAERFREEQTCPNQGVFHFTDLVTLPRATIARRGQLIQFFRVISGCPGCPACCAFLLLDYSSRQIRLVGPVCGEACSAPRVPSDLPVPSGPPLSSPTIAMLQDYWSNAPKQLRISSWTSLGGQRSACS
jgi:hypothetical protein